ncbi:hypothetical protein TIFTF001_055050, partial [Ficus carica]
MQLPTINDIKDVMLSAYSGDVCYASRKGNAVAHCLATLASQFNSFVWFNSVPLFLDTI